MDFHSMKRKQLQALCKKQKIPANLSNVEMANKLTELLEEKEDPLIRQRIKGQDENGSENESANVVVNGKVKKVRFSPEHELIEFTRSREMKRRSRRKSVLSRHSNLSVENVDRGEMNKENVSREGRITRSRGLKLMEAQVNVKERGIKAVNDETTKASAIEIFDNGKLKEGDVDSSGGEMLLRGKMGEGITNASKRGRKRAKDDDNRDEKAFDNINNEKLIEEIVHNTGKITRPRAQKSREASAGERKRGREVVKSIGNVASVRDETDDNSVTSRSSFSNGGDVGEGKLARGSGKRVKGNRKGSEETLDNKKIAGEHDVTEPQIFLRRSKRNADKVADSKMLNGDTRKIEEPIKVEPRRSKRRKNVTGSDKLKAETENKCSLRSSAPELGTAGEVSKHDSKVFQPTGVIGRSRRKTLSLKLVSADEEIKIDSAVKNLKDKKSAVQKSTRKSRRNTSKCKSSGFLDDFGGDSAIHQKKEMKKRKRGPIPGDVIKTTNVPSSAAQSMKESSSKKAVPATGKISDKRKQPSTAKNGNISDAPSHNDSEIGKLIFMDAQVSESEGSESASNLGFSTETSAKNIISDVGPESSRKTRRKKPNISAADSAESCDMNLINGKKLANSDKKAASRIAELKTNSADSENQISASDIRCVEKSHSPFEFNVQELIEQNIIDTDKNGHAAQVFHQMDDTGCDIKTANQVFREGSNVSGKEGLAETPSSADSLLLGDQTDFKTDLAVAEAEEEKSLQPHPSVVDHVGEVKGISVPENLDFSEKRQDNQVLPEGSKVSGTEGFAETSSSADSLLLADQIDIKTDLQVAEADKHIKSCSGVVDHVDEVEGFSVHKNLDSDETRQENKLLPEGLNVSGKEGFAETSSTADDPLLVDQTDIKIDLEVAEAEADKLIQPSPSVVDHVGEVEGTSVQESLDSDETRQAIDMCSPIACHHNDVDHLEASSNIADESKECTSPKGRKVGAFESCERLVDHCTSSKIALKLKAPSSGMLARLEGDDTAGGNQLSFHEDVASELAENNGDGHLNNHKSASNLSSEFGMPNLSDGERGPRIVPKDRGIFLGEYPVMNSDEKGMCEDSLAVAPIAISTNSSNINLKGGHEADHITEREEACVDKSVNSEVGTTVEGGSFKGHKSKCDEDVEFGVSNLFDAEGTPGIVPHGKEIFSGEFSIKDFDEQEMFHGSCPVAPTTMCNHARDREAGLMAEGDEAYLHKDKQSELIEADESGSLRSHKSSKDEDWEFCAFNLFDGEKSARITSQDKGIISAKYSMKDINEQVASPDFPFVSTTCANYKAVNFGADSSHLKDISLSKSKCVSGSQEQPKSPMVKRAAFANTIRRQEAWSTTSEAAGNEMCLLKINSEGKISQILEGSNSDGNDNDANCCKDIKDFVGACITDAKISTDCTISKIGVESLSDMKFQDTKETEQLCENLLARQMESVAGEEPTHVVSRQSWTEIELHNLFATTLDDDTPGPNDTSSQGTEITNLIMSTNKSIAKTGGSLTKKKFKEMEGERSECAEATNKNVVLPTNYEEVSHTRSIDREENQLKFLFATPIKIAAPCKIDETYSHDRKLDRTVMSIMGCFDSLKENIVTQNKSDERAQDAKYEFENSSCPGDPLLDYSKYVTCQELNEIESSDLVHTSIKVLSKAEYAGSEASTEQLTEKIGDCLKEIDLITEHKEEKVISLGQSCVCDEETDNSSEPMEKNIISLSGSPRTADKLEGRQDKLIDGDSSESLSCKTRFYHKYDREITRGSEAAFELPDADLHESNVPENSHSLGASSEDGNILKETTIETFSGPLDAEVAKIGSLDGQKDVIDKGTSPHISSNASPDSDEVTEMRDSIRESDDPYKAKIWDEIDGNPKSSQDISDAQHCKSEVAILESLSIDYNLCQDADDLPGSVELEGTCEAKEPGTTTQNVDNIVAAAEHGSSVCAAVSGILSSSVMHLGDQENCDIEKFEARTPVFNLEGEHENKNGKEADKNSMIQFSIQELHFEGKMEDFNNHIKTISDVPASGCNEILKESDVADTIKEYIDSESSLGMIFDSSSTSLPANVFAHADERTACEDAAFCNNEEDITGRVANSEGEYDKPSVDSPRTESKELAEATSSEPALGSGKAVQPPARVDFLTEGFAATNPLVEAKDSAIKLDSQNQMESEDGCRPSFTQFCSTAKKNARTILIHGTPGKLLSMADMKENAPTRKISDIGDLTTVRPAKRRALQDVQWK